MINMRSVVSMFVGSFLAVVLCAATVANLAAADFTVASPFTDNAVLQRDMAVPVWGTADARATVTVDFAGQKKTAVADADGRWSLKLDPMPANAAPQVMNVSNGKTQVSFSNVLVGEVWICSGQSNMQFQVNKVPEVKALIPKAKNIRTFAVKRTVAMTAQDRLTGKWVENYPDSAVAFSFAYFLERSSDVPVGIILTCWGSSSIEAWMPRDMVQTVPHFKTIMEEFDADTETRERIESIIGQPKGWSGKDDIFLRRQSNILYNAMVHPLVPFACRGLVWYQGERNTQSMEGMLKTPWYSRNSGMLKYGDTLNAWIARYRRAWGNDKMHFMVVMLPGYYKQLKTGPRLGPQKGAEHPTAHSWAWMREGQLKALELEHTSVVNTIDLGDAKNIHPRDKLPVGQRAALLAVSETLGKDVISHGPMLKTVDAQGDRLIVHFENAEGLKTIDGSAPTGFWVADGSRKWVKADAKIDGQTVVLSVSKLKEAIYVRYAFAGKPSVNLVNGANLPAYPFRTDAFEPVSDR